MKHILLLLLFLSCTALSAQVQPCVLTTALRFDNVPVGDSTSSELVVRNACDHDATLLSYDSVLVSQFTGKSGPYFKIVNFPYARTVAPGDSVAFTVWYFPQEVGLRNCMDVVIFGDSPTGSINVCGSGVQPTSLAARDERMMHGGITIGTDEIFFSHLVSITSMSSCEESLELRIVDILGNTVHQETLKLSPQVRSVHVDVGAHGVPAGMYVVVATTTRELVSQPIVIP